MVRGLVVVARFADDDEAGIVMIRVLDVVEEDGEVEVLGGDLGADGGGFWLANGLFSGTRRRGDRPLFDMVYKMTFKKNCDTAERQYLSNKSAQL